GADDQGDDGDTAEGGEDVVRAEAEEGSEAEHRASFLCRGSGGRGGGEIHRAGGAARRPLWKREQKPAGGMLSRPIGIVAHHQVADGPRKHGTPAPTALRSLSANLL